MANDAKKNPEEPALAQDLARGQDLGRQVRLIAAVVLVLVTVALVLDNRGDVRLGWVFGDTTTPLALVIAITFVLGLAVGWLGSHRRRRD